MKKNSKEWKIRTAALREAQDLLVVAEKSCSDRVRNAARSVYDHTSTTGQMDYMHLQLDCHRLCESVAALRGIQVQASDLHQLAVRGPKP